MPIAPNFLMIVGLMSICSSNIMADAKTFYGDRYLENKMLMTSETKGPAVTEEVFQQKLDHKSFTDERIFDQRYYVNKQYARGKAPPVFFYLCGESACRWSSVTNGSVVQLAREMGGVVVALEHRYYGKSQPFTNLLTENLRYLTTEQALLDAEKFQQFFQESYRDSKFIVVGGSYPGSLSAYYRALFPNMVSGSLASSAPVKAKELFEEYDLHVATVVGDECLQKIKQVVKTLEGAVASDISSELESYKKLFQAEAVKHPVDFLYLVADIASAAVQYGQKNQFCSTLMNTDRDNPMIGYAQFARQLYRSWGMSAVDMTFQAAENLSTESGDQLFNMRQWFYQTCTEYGYWQVAYHDEAHSMRSQLVDLSYHRDACKRIFGLEQPADTDAINNRYYSAVVAASTTNILFTNGSNDPWSNLSLTPEHLPAESTLYSIVIPGSAHCDDLRSFTRADSFDLLAARNTFKELVINWIQ